jgi:hypothetical protein
MRRENKNEQAMNKFLLRFPREDGAIGNGCWLSIPDPAGKEQQGMKDFLLRFGRLISVEASHSS